MNNEEKKKNAENNYEKAQKLESNSDFFTASHYYEEALILYRELGDSEGIKKSKEKLIKTSKEASERFQKIEVEQKIPKEKLEKELAELRTLKEGNLSEVLEKIGTCSTFNPKFKEIVKIANSSMPVSMKIATSKTIDANGNTIKGSHDGEYVWIMKIYDLFQGLTSELYLNTLFKELISSKKLNSQDLIAEFEKNKIFSSREFDIIKRGIESYFKEDYITTLHILIPKLEDLFLEFSKSLGITVDNLERSKEIATQPKTLSEVHLDSAEFRKIWGDDLCEQLNFFLFRPLGHKLRHKVCHGKIASEECNFSNATLILYFYILLNARVKEK